MANTLVIIQSGLLLHRSVRRQLAPSFRIINRHAKRYMLAATYGRHNKDEYYTSQPFTADNHNYATKKANNGCNKSGPPGNPHR